MALSTTNLLGTNPAQSALNAKINPPPLSLSVGGSTTAPVASKGSSGGTFNFGTTPAATPSFNISTGENVNPLNAGSLNLSSSGNSQGLVSLPQATQQSTAVSSGGAPSYTPTGTTPAATPPAATTPAPLVSLSGITGALTTAATTGSPAATGYNAQTAAAANTNPAIAANAAAIANNYGSQIANVGALGAGTQAGDLSTGTSPVGEGNANLASNAESNRISALGTAENAALAGTGQQLTAANQQASALNNATQNALTAQGQTQSGLTSAGQLATPSVGAAGQSFYNPETQTSSGNQYGTGPAAAANVQEIQSQTQQVDEYSAAKSEVNNIVSGSLNPLLSQYNINPSNLNQVNSWIQSLAGQTSTPQYQQLSNIMTDLAARYAQILTPAGGSQTDTSRAIATGLLNPSAQGSTFSQVIAGLDAQASQVISGLQSNINTLNNGGNPNTSTTGTSGANTGWASLGD